MPTLNQRITNCIWFDDNGEEAARFYASIIPGSNIGDITYYGKEGYEVHKRPEGSVITVEFTLGGSTFLALNGGPVFKLNPSISFFVVCETIEETDNTWGKLLEGGHVLMEINKYDWSERYGWLQDKYGLTWQISLGKISDVGQKVTPSLMFADTLATKAEEAIYFYTSVFKNSAIDGILKYAKDELQPEGIVKHAQFSLDGQKFMMMANDFKHQFAFNEGVSLIVNCLNQEEIDYFWEKLTEGGQEIECGWLKDKYGVSWQVNPVQLDEMLKSPDKQRAERVMKAFMKMKKFDLKKLEEAFGM